jgi:excisionase family DNA binding protein
VAAKVSEERATTTESESESTAKPMSDCKPQLQIVPTDEWLTAKEAAKHLKVKPRTLLLWARQGKLQAFALSGTKRHVWRFRRQDLDAALLESAVLPSQSPSVRPAEERMG